MLNDFRGRSEHQRGMILPESPNEKTKVFQIDQTNVRNINKLQALPKETS